MINRKKIIKERNRHFIFHVSLGAIFIMCLVLFGINLSSNPSKVHKRFVEDGKKYAFIAVGAKHLRETSNEYQLTLINKENELIDVVVKTAKTKDNLLNASKENPVKFIGETYNRIHSDSKTESYFKILKQKYFKNAKKLYSYELIEFEPKKSGLYYFLLAFFILLFLLVFIAIILSIHYSKKRIKNVIEFLDKNDYYNTCPADLNITKYISIIKNYIFITTAKPKIIDLTICRDFKLIYHPEVIFLASSASFFASSICLDKSLIFIKISCDLFLAYSSKLFLSIFFRASISSFFIMDFSSLSVIFLELSINPAVKSSAIVKHSFVFTYLLLSFSNVPSHY